MNESVNPQMIVLARESREMTQSELSKRVGISQAEVSRYESGARMISQEYIQLIADILDYPVEFFYQQEQRYGLGSNGVYHRKRKAVSTKLLDKLSARVNILRLMITRLLRDVDIDHDHRFPQYDVDEFKGDIERIAELVRAAWKLPAGPVIDLVGIIENAGGVVLKTDFGTEKVDAIVQWIPPSPPVFLMNERFPGERIRFTLAHEIGHLVMHDLPRERIEEEADEFASAFLMPAKDILPYFKKVDLQHLTQIKPYWRVSLAALIQRAYKLECITERQYRSLRIELGPYRLNEPLPIAMERPTLWTEILEAYQKDLGYSDSEIAKLVHLQEKDLRQNYYPQKQALRLVS